MSRGIRRYWFPVAGHLGIGVSAETREAASKLALGVAAEMGWQIEADEVVENVDIRDLDERHVVPNMGPPTVRGVWYPRRNL